MDDRHLSAFIPCHTEHCAVFAPPVHRPNTLQETSSDSTCDTAGRVADAFLDNDAPTAAINAETLDDLRLIQPPNRDNSNLSVLAGHFDFYAPYRALPQCMQPVTTVPSFTNTNRSSDTDPARGRWSKHVLATVDPHNPAVSDAPPPSPTCRVSCLTIGRHPVDRAISYYYQRFYQHPSKVTKKQPTGAPATGESSHSDQGGTPPVSASPGVPAEGKTSRPLNQHTINELTPAELELVALSTREGMTSHFYPDVQVFIDEGMADAACSALLGLKYTSGRPVGPIAIPPEIPAALYPRARTNLRQCVVGLQEQWNQTLQVLDHWFPWLDYSDNPTRKKMSIYSGLETRKTLRVELHDVLVALNPCDMMLYEEMQKIFAAQLEVLKLDAF